MIDVETVSVLVTDEVLESDVLDVAVTSVRLDHHLLVGILSIDVGVGNGGDGCSRAEGSNGTSSAPVAVDVLDQVVTRWVLDGHAFVLVCNFDVVDVVVGSRDVNSVETAPVSSANDDVVDLVFCQQEDIGRSVRLTCPFTQLSMIRWNAGANVIKSTCGSASQRLTLQSTSAKSWKE